VARERAGSERPVHLVLENDRNAARYLRRDGSGRARLFDAQWNDDFHHAVHALLTGEGGGYYGDYAIGPMRHLARILAEGFAYQGEPSRHRGNVPRGEPSADLPPTAFVSFLQNHDQIGNRAFGERLGALASPDATAAAAALLLLAPQVPLLFMGEEWDAPEPFPFFCDFGPELAEAVRDGRRREFAGFALFSDPQMRERIPDPIAPSTAASAVLDWDRREQPLHRERLQLYRRLLALRKAEIVPRLAGMQGGGAEIETVGERCCRVRWRLGDGALLRLCANLGDVPAQIAAAPPQGRVHYESHDGLAGLLAGGTLPPWSVLWTIDQPSRP
jgi:malto-oligosyltrehalose trehalohydrolase